MKNALLLLLFIVGLASCTIEKRRYFKGYHVALRQAQEPGKRERGEVEKRESAQERQSEAQQSAAKQSEAQQSTASNASNTSNNEKPQRGEIIIARENEIEKDTSHVNEAPKPQRGEIVIEEIVIEEIVIKSPESTTTASVPWPNQYTGQAASHKKSHALEGLGVIFLIGIITLVLIVGLLLFIFTDSAVFAIIGSLILGLVLAVGIYLLLLAVFFALLLFIIKTFGA
jgi:cobalamin biosynthesis Mg chelatase CobN